MHCYRKGYFLFNNTCIWNFIQSLKYQDKQVFFVHSFDKKKAFYYSIYAVQVSHNERIIKNIKVFNSKKIAYFISEKRQVTKETNFHNFHIEIF